MYTKLFIGFSLNSHKHVSKIVFHPPILFCFMCTSTSSYFQKCKIYTRSYSIRIHKKYYLIDKEYVCLTVCLSHRYPKKAESRHIDALLCN